MGPAPEGGPLTLEREFGDVMRSPNRGPKQALFSPQVFGGKSATARRALLDVDLTSIPSPSGTPVPLSVCADRAPRALLCEVPVYLSI